MLLEAESLNQELSSLVGYESKRFQIAKLFHRRFCCGGAGPEVTWAVKLLCKDLMRQGLVC
jgi:hypothetical protein